MIGVGIITCNREKFFKNCINSIPAVDYLVVINDGKQYASDMYTLKPNVVLEHKHNLGVGKSKNEALRILLKKQCDHIFLIEDDIIIKNPSVFEQYIKTADKTGLYHLNFAFHGDGNRDENNNPVPRKNVIANGEKYITLSKNLLGAFTYYHRVLLDKFGLFDERFYNAWEHVDHTYQIIKAGLHSPFWWFADIPKSYDYILDQDDYHFKSEIRKRKLMWKFRLRRNTMIFKRKNGYSPSEIPDTSEEIVLAQLDKIRDQYSGGRIFKVL